MLAAAVQYSKVTNRLLTAEALLLHSAIFEHKIGCVKKVRGIFLIIVGFSS